MTLENWTPIGSSTEPFSGSFDGNGYTITLRSFANDVLSASGSKYLGIFGYTRGAAAGTAVEIRSLSISSAISQTITTSGTLYMGLLVGYADGHTNIDSISVSGSLTVSRALPGGYGINGGGIVGCVKSSRISNSTSAVSLDFSSAAEPDIAGNAGGIAGYGADGTVITNCSATGSVQVASRGFQSGAGGIVGYITGAASEVSRCSASGNITMIGLYQQEFAGGIAGYSGGKSKIFQCRYTGGTVQDIGPANEYPYAGGISGHNYGGAVIEECYSSGTIRAEGLLPYAGGIAGYTSAQAAAIKNSYSSMTVLAVSRGRTALAGGITAATANTGKTSKCYATATVSVDVSGGGGAGEGLGVAAGANAGGISGSIYYGENSTVEYCVALNPSVTGSDSSGGADFNVYRLAGEGTGGTNVRTHNYAWSGMALKAGGNTVSPSDTGPNARDGADCVAKPAQSV
ncbi:MAG: hypothetical protein LBO76_05250, partial [Treponema sp.]|nr:hypothetical protein [Treponema sp.]